MKFQAMVLASVLGAIALELPSTAQGAFVTTVNVYSTGQTGHNQVQRQQQEDIHQFYNGFSLSTDSKREADSNTNSENGITTTETYTYGETTTSYSIEKGDYHQSTIVNHLESYDYADFNHVHTLTTGANGERGPQRANDRNRRRR